MTSAPAISVQFRPSVRESWIDVAKGWGILLVVLGHALRALHNVELLPQAGWSQALDAWIYSFHMPFFFLLSGLFIERAVAKPWPEALKDRLKNILWPYLLWSLLQTLVQIQMSRYTTSQYNWTHLIGILWKPLMQFWFLYVLLLLSLLWLGLRQCGVSPWTLLGVAWILHLTQNGNGIWPIWDLIRIHGFWFALGAVLGITPGILERLRATPRSLAWIGLFLGFALTGWGAVNVTTSLLGASMLWAMPGLVASLWLAMSLPTHWPLTQALAWMGRLSLEIYLVHTLASATTRVILLHGFQIRNVTLHLILSLLAGILIPMALVLMTRRLQWRHIFRFGTVA